MNTSTWWDFIPGDKIVSKYADKHNRIWQVIKIEDKDNRKYWYSKDAIAVKLISGDPWINRHSGAFDICNPKIIFVGDEQCRYVCRKNYKPYEE